MDLKKNLSIYAKKKREKYSHWMLDSKPLYKGTNIKKSYPGMRSPQLEVEGLVKYF